MKDVPTTKEAIAIATVTATTGEEARRRFVIHHPRTI